MVVVAQVTAVVADVATVVMNVAAIGAQVAMVVTQVLAIMSDIGAHLTDGELSVAEVAQRQRVTARYVHKLFENEGLTFSSFVLGRRLARAHRMLSDPRLAGCTIGSVAFDVGFGDLSYFNRTFRRRYGAAPREIRQSAMRADPPA